MDCLNRLEWYEDEQFWTTVRPAMFCDQRIARTEEDASDVFKLLGLKKGDSVIDACSGFGRYSIALAHLGCNVQSVDLCKAFTEELNRTALAQSLPITTACHDIRTYDFHELHDAAVLLYTSFGYFLERDDDLTLIRNLYKALKPDGRILADIYSVHNVCRNLVQVQEAADFLSIKQRTIDIGKSSSDSMWIDVEWLTATPKGVDRFIIGQRFYTAQGVSRLFTDAGFTNTRIMSDYKGSTYIEDSDTVVIVAEKPRNQKEMKI